MKNQSKKSMSLLKSNMLLMAIFTVFGASNNLLALIEAKYSTTVTNTTPVIVALAQKCYDTVQGGAIYNKILLKPNESFTFSGSRSIQTMDHPEDGWTELLLTEDTKNKQSNRTTHIQQGTQTGYWNVCNGLTCQSDDQQTIGYGIHQNFNTNNMGFKSNYTIEYLPVGSQKKPVISDADITKYLDQMKDAKAKGDDKTVNELISKLVNGLQSSSNQHIQQGMQIVQQHGMDLSQIINDAFNKLFASNQQNGPADKRSSNNTQSSYTETVQMIINQCHKFYPPALTTATLRFV